MMQPHVTASLPDDGVTYLLEHANNLVAGRTPR
jgi:hypothetical protein